MPKKETDFSGKGNLLKNPVFWYCIIPDFNAKSVTKRLRFLKPLRKSNICLRSCFYHGDLCAVLRRARIFVSFDRSFRKR